VTYIIRQLVVNKLKRSIYLIEFTLNIQCCKSRKQSQTVLFFQWYCDQRGKTILADYQTLLKSWEKTTV